MFPKQFEPLQIMSHAVVGFPTLEDNINAIDGLVSAGVKYIELQVPFSDPVADGHTLVNACYKALKTGGSVQATIDLAKVVCEKHPDATFIIMTYINPIYRYGLEEFYRAAADAGVKALIVPDWPVEQVEPWLPLLDELGLAPILLVTPNTPDNRLERISNACRGMLYVVSRMGVTGHRTKWGDEFDAYLAKIRSFCDLPLAVGFGVRDIDDLSAIQGKAEVAAFCSQYIEWLDKDGHLKAGQKMKTLVNELAEI